MNNSLSLDETKEREEIGLKVTDRENGENVTPARTAQLYGLTTHLQVTEEKSTLLTCYPCDEIKVSNEILYSNSEMKQSLLM